MVLGSIAIDGDSVTITSIMGVQLNSIGVDNSQRPFCWRRAKTNGSSIGSKDKPKDGIGLSGDH